MNKQQGYIVDTVYPTFFYKEMLPVWLNTVVHILGFETPNIKQSFSYLELACAQGTNLLVCAIQHPDSYFLGIDFNEKHIQKAQQNVADLGLNNIEFIHCDFETFLTQNKKKFDFIVNHGTFSWISSIHQQHILNIVSQFLKDSGLFYLHYMCYPGSTDLHSIQKLFNLVDRCHNQSSLNNIKLGQQLFSDLYQAGAFIDQPKVNQLIKTLQQDPAYLAHEFLTDHWQPLYSVDVHQRVFETSKISFLGSANPCENIENLSIPTQMQAIIKNTSQPALKEYLKDLARNSKQRVDIFQKKTKPLTQEKYLQVLNQFEFKLLAHIPTNKTITFQTSIGEIKAVAEIIDPLFENLKNNKNSFLECLDLNIFKNNPLFLIETLFLLMNANYIHPILINNKKCDPKIIQKWNQIMPFKMSEQGWIIQ